MDLKNPKLLYLKGGLFVLAGTLACIGILLLAPSVRIAALLVIAIWSFARAYYFAFYVVNITSIRGTGLRVWDRSCDTRFAASGSRSGMTGRKCPV